MKIVISGAGQIGTHIAQMYSLSESNEIVLMDLLEENLSEANRTADISTFVGSGSSIEDLQKIDIASADLFISVTQSEEVNLMSCYFAKSLGAKKVVARVDREEFVREENQTTLANLAIDSYIFPEALAKDEVISYLKFSRCKLLQEFNDTDYKIYSLKVLNPAIIGKTLSEINALFALQQTQVLGIRRKMRTVVASAEQRIEKSDVIFVLSQEQFIDEIKEQCNGNDFITRNVIILGGSRIGEMLARYLQKSMNVKLIERNKDKCFKLAEKLEKTMIIHGNGTHAGLLAENDIASTNVFISVTENSETNILAALLAAEQGVTQTIAEVENTSFLKLASNSGVGMLVNKKIISANYIYKATCLSSLIQSSITTEKNSPVLVFLITQQSKITKKPLGKLSLPESIRIVAVIRAGILLELNDETQLQTEDKVIVFSSIEGIVSLEKLF